MEMMRGWTSESEGGAGMDGDGLDGGRGVEVWGGRGEGWLLGWGGM